MKQRNVFSDTSDSRDAAEGWGAADAPVSEKQEGSQPWPRRKRVAGAAMALLLATGMSAGIAWQTFGTTQTSIASERASSASAASDSAGASSAGVSSNGEDSSDAVSISEGSSESSSDAAAVSSASATELASTAVQASSDAVFSGVNATITLSDGGASIDGTGAEATDTDKVTITAGGTYVLTGTFGDGRVVIDAEGQDVTLILNGVCITKSDKGAIYAKAVGTLTVELAEGSSNVIVSGTSEDYQAITSGETTLEELTSDATDASSGDASSSADSGTKDNVKAAIYSSGDLYLTGTGSLAVVGYLNNGIQAEGLLSADSSSVSVAAANDGVSADAGLALNSGTYSIDAYGDALQSNGDISIADGTYSLTAGGGAGEAEAASAADFGQAGAGMGAEGGVQAPTASGAGMGAGSGMQGGAPQGGQMFGGAAPDAMGTDTASTMASTMASTATSTSTSTDTDDEVSQKGIKADGTISISGGTVQIDAAEDGLNAKTAIAISGGTVTISAGDDGMHSDADLVIDGGEITISQSNEGIEGATISINGGDIAVTSSDDGLNASSDTATPLLTINGGNLSVNAGGDGIDSNGNLVINGGTVVIDGPTTSANGALDAATESGSTITVNGGTLIAMGASGMLEAPDSSASTQVSLVYVFSSAPSAGEEVTVSDSSGNVVCTFTPAKGAASVILSTPDLVQGETYTFTYGDTSESITADSIVSSNATGGMSGFGGSMQGGRMGR